MPITHELSPAEKAALGKALLAEWLTTYNSNNPIHNIAIVEVDRAFKLGDFLDVQKNYVKINTDKIKSYNLLAQDIIDLKPANDTDTGRKLGQLKGEDIGTNAAPGKDAAAILARANAFIDHMHAVGLALEIRKVDSSGKEVPWTKVDDLPGTDGDTCTNWSNKLQSKTEYINTTAQQDQINLQTILGQFNKAYEMVTASIKKNGDLWAAIIHNLKAG